MNELNMHHTGQTLLLPKQKFARKMSVPSGLERWTGDRVGLGSKPAAATSLRNFGNSVYPALPVCFGGDSKSRRSILSGVYVTGSKIFSQSTLEMCNLL